MDLLCFCSVLCLLCFVHVCLYVLCGHLLGKGWPLGSRLWCLLWVCHFPIGILGQVWYLIVSIPDLCTITYFSYSSTFQACVNPDRKYSYETVHQQDNSPTRFLKTVHRQNWRQFTDTFEDSSPIHLYYIYWHITRKYNWLLLRIIVELWLDTISRYNLLRRCCLIIDRQTFECHVKLVFILLIVLYIWLSSPTKQIILFEYLNRLVVGLPFLFWHIFFVYFSQGNVLHLKLTK